MRAISELPGIVGANIIVQVLAIGFQFESHHDEYFLDRFNEPGTSSSAPAFESASAMLTKSIPESHWSTSSEIEVLLWDGSVLADQTFAPFVFFWISVQLFKYVFNRVFGNDQGFFVVSQGLDDMR
jgi:hypothetical protein